MAGLWAQVKAYLHTCRYEYFPGEAPAMLVPIFLTATPGQPLISVNLLIGLVAFLLLFLSGFTINAYTDRKLDENYDSFKRNISSSVGVLGAKRLLYITIAQVVIAVILAGIVAYRMSEPLLFLMVLVGVFLGIGYSIKPLNFKERGSIWHAVALGTSIFFIPLLFLYWIAAGELTAFIIILAAGFSLVHYAMEYGNQANDYLEDREAHVMTPPVRLGIAQSLKVATIMFIAGAFIVGFSFYYLVFNNEALLAHFSTGSLWLVVLVIWAVLAAGYYLPVRGLYRMWIISAESEDIEKDMPLIKQQCNYSHWQTSGIMGLLFVSIIIFGTNMVTLDMTVEPLEGAHFSDPPSATLVNSGSLFNPDYYVDTFLFIRSEDSEVESGTLQVQIEVDENGVVYESQILNVTHRLLPRETWTRMVHLDVREFATSTVTITLMEDDDGDGTYTVERDRWTKTVRVYPTGGNSLGADEEEAGTGLLDRLPEVPIDIDRRPTDLGY
jgi:4-hydroxybenzoate polyprenyltransferase